MLTPLMVATLLSTSPETRPTVQSALAGLHAVVHFERVAISPDGQRVAWVEAVPTPDGPSGTLRIIKVSDRTGTQVQRLTAGKDGAFSQEDEPAFSPDGQELAFLSDAEHSGQPQLYVADLKNRAIRKLTQATGQLSAPAWSPDAKALSVLYLEGAVDALGPLGPSARETGVIEDVVHEQRIATVSAEGGQLLPISPADLFIYEYAWSPDGTQFVATGAHGVGDNNWWLAELFLIPKKSGQAALLHHPTLQLCEPTWSPDGTRVAFIEGLMSDAGANGGDVFVMSLAGGARARNVTAGMRASATELSWTAAGGLVAAAAMEGDAAFLRVDSEHGSAPKTLWRASESVTRHWGVSAAFDGDGQTSAVIRSSALQAPDIFAGPIGSWTRISTANRDVRSPAAAVKNLTWSSDGRSVQGWLLLPSFDGGKGTAPLIVWVHGGPASVVTNEFDPDVLLMVTQGYAVFQPNPRGSFGQGESFTRANVKDFGHGDLRDILSGVNRAAATEGVDGTRVGIIGHSYGGYMVMFAVTQTARFKAAIASAGIANWMSYYGENKIDQWMLPYFGSSVYADPAVYARSAPMTFITHTTTPTLVLVGERDAECPAPQSYEFWHALKTLGVPTQLVVYADEGHHFRSPDHVLDRVQREVAWFDRYLKGTILQPSR
jgi:dipeptidyl aminopeptidase/acylaminoacyl peptidase